jgi:regulator of ribosome biosynthesis
MEAEGTFDLRNLAYLEGGVRIKGDSKNLERDLLNVVTEAGQKLVNKIFSLPTEDSEYGPLVALPDRDNNSMKLPREKRIPEPKPETKWEKFAREKGIKNTKKERMVYDEEHDVYRPRYGYKSIKSGIDDIPIIEVKNGEDPFADPWAENKKEKKENKDKNTKKQLKNQEANLRRAGKLKKSAESQNDVAPFGALQNAAASSKRSKGDLKKMLQQTQRSTASMGNFDHARKGEGEIKKLTGKKRAFRDNLGSVSEENVMMKSRFKQFADVVDKKARKVSNSLKEYEGVLPDARTTFKAKKGGTKIGGGGGAKSKPAKANSSKAKFGKK